MQELQNAKAVGPSGLRIIAVVVLLILVVFEVADGLLDTQQMVFIITVIVINDGVIKQIILLRFIVNNTF